MHGDGADEAGDVDEHTRREILVASGVAARVAHTDRDAMGPAEVEPRKLAQPAAEPVTPSASAWEIIRARDPLDAVIVDAYRLARWERYALGLGLAVPDEPTWAGLREVVRAAMACGHAPRSAARAVLSRWFAKDGHKSFLRDVSHDLRRIGPDLSDLAAAFDRPVQAPTAERARTTREMPTADAAGAAAAALALLGGAK